MKWPWSGASIRLRLTAWYGVVLTLMLVMYATATYLAVRHEFTEQLDEQLHDDFEEAEGLLAHAPDGRVIWARERPDHHDAGDDAARLVEVWGAGGEQMHRSGAAAILPPLALASVRSSYLYETVDAAGERWRTLTAPVTIDGRADVLRVSRSADGLQRQLREILVVLALGLPLVVALAGIGGYILARRALAPIDQLATEARRITAERLHERLTVLNQTDEIGRLTHVINGTFSRLESSFEQLRRFTADASHELRTPLAVIRGLGEAAVADRRSPADYKEAIGSMLEEVDRMTHLVDTLLRLSRGDAGTIRLSLERIDAGAFVREAVASLAVLAEERGQNVTIDVVDEVLVEADRLVLREAITNLLDNAIKYSPAESTVAVRVQRTGNQAILTVTDEGPGIPLEHRERIFDRFFRVDEARSRDRGGAGLGLAIAKWAVGIHGGSISVVQPDRGGSEFRIALPVAPVAAPSVDAKAAQGRIEGTA